MVAKPSNLSGEGPYPTLTFNGAPVHCSSERAGAYCSRRAAFVRKE